MYNLHLTAEQLEMRDTVREFVRNEIRPVTLAPRRLEPFDKPLLPNLLGAASKMGLRSLALAEERGGAGGDSLTSCLVVEELAQGDIDLAVVLAHTSVLAQIVFDHLTSDAQRSAHLPQFLEDAEFHLAFAGSHPEAGVAASYHRPRADRQNRDARAQQQADGEWLLTGSFSAVANGAVAKLFVVEAETADGLLTFLVPRDAQGLNVQELEAPVAWRPGASSVRWAHGAPARLVLDNCRVSANGLLGSAAGEAARAYFKRLAPQIAAANIGIGQAAYEAAVDYAKLRRQGGRQIIEHQAIGTLLADVAIKLESARALVWKAAWALDHPHAVADRSVTALPLHHIAQSHAAETIVRVTERAAECFGAMGVMRDMPMQKYVGDALVFKHGELGHAATKLLIAEAVAGYEPN